MTKLPFLKLATLLILAYALFIMCPTNSWAQASPPAVERLQNLAERLKTVSQSTQGQDRLMYASVGMNAAFLAMQTKSGEVPQAKATELADHLEKIFANNSLTEADAQAWLSELPSSSPQPNQTIRATGSCQTENEKTGTNGVLDSICKNGQWTALNPPEKLSDQRKKISDQVNAATCTPEGVKTGSNGYWTAICQNGHMVPLSPPLANQDSSRTNPPCKQEGAMTGSNGYWTGTCKNGQMTPLNPPVPM